MKLKKYLTLTRAGVIESLQFRLSTLIMIAGNLLYLIIVYFLWKAIYASAGTDTVSGMTFTETLIYLVLATALFGFMEMYTVWEIGRNIQSGKIVLDLLKPMKYRSYLFWSYSGSFVTNFFFTFFSNISDCNVCYTRCGSHRYQSVVICSVSDNGSSDKLQCRFYCGNNLSLYGVNMGHQYYETGGCSSVVRSNNTAGFLSRAFEDNGISSSVSVNLQCTAFYFAVYFVG